MYLISYTTNRTGLVIEFKNASYGKKAWRRMTRLFEAGEVDEVRVGSGSWHGCQPEGCQPERVLLARDERE